MSRKIPYRNGQPGILLVQLQKHPEKAYGFNLSRDKQNAFPYVNYIVTGTPADTAGIRPDDLIVEVNGQKVLDRDLKDIVKKIAERRNRVDFLIVRPWAFDFYQNRTSRESVKSLEVTRRATANPRVPQQNVSATGQNNITSEKTVTKTTRHIHDNSASKPPISQSTRQTTNISQSVVAQSPKTFKQSSGLHEEGVVTLKAPGPQKTTHQVMQTTSNMSQVQMQSSRQQQTAILQEEQPGTFVTKLNLRTTWPRKGMVTKKQRSQLLVKKEEPQKDHKVIIRTLERSQSLPRQEERRVVKVKERKAFSPPVVRKQYVVQEDRRISSPVVERKIIHSPKVVRKKHIVHEERKVASPVVQRKAKRESDNVVVEEHRKIVTEEIPKYPVPIVDRRQTQTTRREIVTQETKPIPAVRKSKQVKEIHMVQDIIEREDEKEEEVEEEDIDGAVKLESNVDDREKFSVQVKERWPLPSSPLFGRSARTESYSYRQEAEGIATKKKSSDLLSRSISLGPVDVSVEESRLLNRYGRRGEESSTLVISPVIQRKPPVRTRSFHMEMHERRHGSHGSYRDAYDDVFFRSRSTSPNERGRIIRRSRSRSREGRKVISPYGDAGSGFVQRLTPTERDAVSQELVDDWKRLDEITSQRMVKKRKEYEDSSSRWLDDSHVTSRDTFREDTRTGRVGGWESSYDRRMKDSAMTTEKRDIDKHVLSGSGEIMNGKAEDWFRYERKISQEPAEMGYRRYLDDRNESAKKGEGLSKTEREIKVTKSYSRDASNGSQYMTDQYKSDGFKIDTNTSRSQNLKGTGAAKSSSRWLEEEIEINEVPARGKRRGEMLSDTHYEEDIIDSNIVINGHPSEWIGRDVTLPERKYKEYSDRETEKREESSMQRGDVMVRRERSTTKTTEDTNIAPNIELRNERVRVSKSSRRKLSDDNLQDVYDPGFSEFSRGVPASSKTTSRHYRDYYDNLEQKSRDVRNPPDLYIQRVEQNEEIKIEDLPNTSSRTVVHTKTSGNSKINDETGELRITAAPESKTRVTRKERVGSEDSDSFPIDVTLDQKHNEIYTRPSMDDYIVYKSTERRRGLTSADVNNNEKSSVYKTDIRSFDTSGSSTVVLESNKVMKTAGLNARDASRGDRVVEKTSIPLDREYRQPSSIATSRQSSEMRTTKDVSELRQNKLFSRVKDKNNPSIRSSEVPIIITEVTREERAIPSSAAVVKETVEVERNARNTPSSTAVVREVKEEKREMRTVPSSAAAVSEVREVKREERRAVPSSAAVFNEVTEVKRDEVRAGPSSTAVVNEVTGIKREAHALPGSTKVADQNTTVFYSEPRKVSSHVSGDKSVSVAYGDADEYRTSITLMKPRIPISQTSKAVETPAASYGREGEYKSLVTVTAEKPVSQITSKVDTVTTSDVQRQTSDATGGAGSAEIISDITRKGASKVSRENRDSKVTSVISEEEVHALMDLERAVTGDDARSEKTVRCNICKNQMFTTEGVTLKSCRHHFDRGCIARYVESSVGEDVVRCPVKHCDGHVLYHEIQELVSPEVFKKHFGWDNRASQEYLANQTTAAPASSALVTF